MANENINNNHHDQDVPLVFSGTMVHSTIQAPLEILKDTVIGVQGGKILFVEPKAHLDDLLAKHSLHKDCVRQLSKSQFLMPGLIDTHIHAPQYVYTGTALDLPLLKWLERFTFPTEAKFKDISFANHAYRKVVRRTLSCGTTTAQYFATIHKEASLKLAEIAGELGQRAFVGKVNADIDSPEFYIEDTDQSLADTEWFIEKVQALGNPIVSPVVTPRFVLSCSEKLMKGLGKIAKQHSLRIQSHISENRDEVELVLRNHPDCKNYTEVYDKCGLMTNQTVMAHGIYLDDTEIEVFKEKGAAVSHCPCSNFSLRSGVMDCRRMKDKGVKLGLGTDVSGGYNPSMFGSMREAFTASNVQSIQRQPKDNYKHLSFPELFQLATLGGSQALGLEDQVGNFVAGKEFDALLVNVEADDSPFDVFHSETYSDSWEDMIQKFVFLGDDRNIEEVYVSGRRVKPFSDTKDQSSSPQEDK